MGTGVGPVVFCDRKRDQFSPHIGRMKEKQMIVCMVQVFAQRMQSIFSKHTLRNFHLKKLERLEVFVSFTLVSMKEKIFRIHILHTQNPHFIHI